MNPFAGQIAYRMFRAWGRPEVLPLNYTFSLTARCNYAAPPAGSSGLGSGK